MQRPDPAQLRAVSDAEEQLWRQRVGALRAAPDLIRNLGADPKQVMAAAGLHESDFDLPDNTVPYAACGRFYHLAAQATGCEHFGLLVGQSWQMKSLGLLGELMRNAPTVGEALRKISVYHHLNSQGGVVVLRADGPMAEFGYAIYHRSVLGVRQIFDSVLATGVTFMRELCGPAWVPTEVLLAHAPPADPSPFRQLFRCPVRFNADESVLRFPSHWLARPVQGSDARLLRQLQARANALPPPDLVDRLRRSLRVLLLNRVVSGDAVAEMLAVHRRTLNRRLEALGTTFRAVLEGVRFEAACQLLQATELTQDDIADALGYAGVSPFTRAFRRQAGIPPGQWRREANERSAEGLRMPERPQPRPVQAQPPAQTRPEATLQQAPLAPAAAAALGRPDSAA